MVCAEVSKTQRWKLELELGESKVKVPYSDAAEPHGDKQPLPAFTHRPKLQEVSSQLRTPQSIQLK